MSQTDPTSADTILVLVRDLMLSSKITSTARAIGVTFKQIREASKLDAEVGSGRLIVDLTQEGFPEAAARWKQRTAGFVTGFAGHTETETLAKAQQLGLDEVLARGAFVAMLPTILQRATERGQQS